MHGMESNFNKCTLMFNKMTSGNSVFAVRYAYSNDFGASQTRKTLYVIAKIRKLLIFPHLFKSQEVK